MRRRSRVPGCLFINNGRYWWRIRLPGEKAKKARPLVPAGGQFATDDPGAAEESARNTYAQAVDVLKMIGLHVESGGTGGGYRRRCRRQRHEGQAKQANEYSRHGRPPWAIDPYDGGPVVARFHWLRCRSTAS